MVIRNAVQCGEIQQAIERTNAVDPAILAGDPELSFKLKQQQLVELIRSGGVEEALAFAPWRLAYSVASAEESAGGSTPPTPHVKAKRKHCATRRSFTPSPSNAMPARP